LNNLKQSVTEEDQEIVELENALRRIKDLTREETYLGWRDVIADASKLAFACRRTEQERRNKVLNSISELQERLLTVVRNPYAGSTDQSAISGVNSRISQARSDLRNLRSHTGILALCAQIAQDMDKIEIELLRISRRNKMFARLRAFLKDFLVFLAIGAVCLAGSPFVFYCLPSASFLSELIEEKGVAWIYEALPVFAIISSVCFALIRDVLRDRQETS
jgi:hypothetical protein